MIRPAVTVRVLGLAFAFHFSAALANAEAPASDVGVLRVAIDWTPTKPEREGAIWLAYLMARTRFIDAHPQAHPRKVGVISPTFEEEVVARSIVTKIYREIQQQDKDLDLPYFNNLVRVVDSSFIREYVWTFLHQSTWTQVPDDLRLQEFESWAKGNLSHHQVSTKGQVRFEIAKE